MLQSRLYWRVLLNFGIFVAMVAVMTIATLSLLRNIESDFQSSADRIVILSTVEQLQHDLSVLPTLADDYARTGEFVLRLTYERTLRETKLRLANLIESTNDSSAIMLLNEANTYLARWAEESGNRRIQMGEFFSGDELVHNKGDMTHQPFNDRYHDYVRNLLREFYREQLSQHQSNILNALYLSGNMITYVYIMNILIAIFAIVLSLVLARSIVAPLRTLKESTEQLTNGTFEPIEVDRKDELGELTEHFNKMSLLMYSRLKRLNMYSQFVTNLNAVTTIRNIAHQTITHVCNYAGSHAAALYLLNQHTNTLEHVSSLGLELVESSVHTVGIGDGIIGRCAATREWIERSCETGPDFTIPGLPKDTTGILLAIPLEFRSKVLGVLVLISRNALTREQYETINESIQQCTIAINNARHREEIQNLSLQVAHTNKELKGKLEKLLIAHRTKSELLVRVSHELCTPLKSIVECSSSLLNSGAGALSADQRESIETLQRNCAHSLHLVHTMLEMSRLECGNVSISVSTSDSEEIVQETLRTIDHVLVAKKLVFHKQIQKSLPPLRTDIMKVREILTNLLSTAVKLTDKGEIILRVYQNGSMVNFEVQGAGFRVPAEKQKIISEGFSRLDSGDHHRQLEMDIGLAIAQRLAHVLGGTILVRSHPHEGSTFTLSIPLIIGPTAVQGEKGTYETQGLLEYSKVPEFICIGDDPETVNRIKNRLAQNGYFTMSKSTLHDEVRLGNRIQPTLITLNGQVSDDDDLQILGTLKEHTEMHDLPVGIHSRTNSAPLTVSPGTIDVMPKPTDIDKLMSLVQSSCTAKNQYVLVVDDDETYAILLREVLEYYGVSAKVAHTGSDALRIIQESKPALIFIELGMQKKDGFSLLRTLKTREEFGDIHVVMLASKPSSRKQKQDMGAESLHYVMREQPSHESMIGSVRNISTENLTT